MRCADNGRERSAACANGDVSVIASDWIIERTGPATLAGELGDKRCRPRPGEVVRVRVKG